MLYEPLMILVEMMSCRNPFCCGKGNARTHFIPCLFSVLGGRCGIWLQLQWRGLYLREIAFQYTREPAVSKGFSLTGRGVTHKKWLVS